MACSYVICPTPQSGQLTDAPNKPQRLTVHMMFITDRKSGQHEMAGVDGENLMLHLRRLKVGVRGLCNGNAMCGTCHVYVRIDDLKRLDDPEFFEEEMLETLPERRPQSRLACQLTYTPDLDGLELTVAPEY